jgi:predicted RNase H-like HicB family nuclease
MNKYLIIIEKTEDGYSAYSPDVTGCVAVGDTKREVEKNMREALRFHIELLVEKGYPVPKPTMSDAMYVSLPAFAA